MSPKLAQTMFLAVGLATAYPASGQKAPRSYEEALAIVDSLHGEYLDKLHLVFRLPADASDPRFAARALCDAEYEAARNEITPLIPTDGSGGRYAIPDTSNFGLAAWAAAGGSGLFDDEARWVCWMTPPPRKSWWIDRFQRLYREKLLELINKRR